MKNNVSISIIILSFIAASAVLFLMSRSNYLLFHSLVESSSVAIAFGIFIVTWHTRKVTSTPFFLVLGIGYLFVGGLDFFHLLAYRGMGVFPHFSDNEPTQFWIAARTFETLTILLSTFFIRKQLFDHKFLFITYGFCFLAISASILHFKTFPACYTSDGMTTFKVAAQYALVALLMVNLYRFYHFRAHFQNTVLKVLCLSLLMTALAEICFTFYADPYGLFNMLGHFFRIGSFGLVYRAVIIKRLEEPYDVLLGKFRKSQEELFESKRLFESRVQQRTSQLEATNEELIKQNSEKVEQSRALRESQERFRVALKNSRIVMAHCDENMRYTWIHSDYPDFGDERFIGKNDLELGDREIFKDLWDIKAEVMKKGSGVVREVYLKSDDAVTFFEVTAEPLINEHCGKKGVTIALLDITERKKADERLRVRHNTLEAVYAIATSFSSSKETLYDQIILSISSVLDSDFVAIGRINGDRVETVSLYFEGEFRYDNEVNLDCTLRIKVFTQKQAVQTSGDLEKTDPQCVCFQLTGARSYLGVPIMNCDGNVLGFICVLDKNEKTFTSEEVHCVEIFAGYVAQEFERDHIQKELFHSKEMQLLGRLTSGVAHEVRNPLNALTAVTEALFQDLEDTEEFMIYKEHISSQVDRLSRLMQDLLEMGKPFDESRRTSINCFELIRSTVNYWKSSARRKHSVSMMIDDGSQEAFISGDHIKLQQVMINLLDNASQHSPEGSDIQIFLETGHYEKIHIRIADQGKGVEQNVLERIFEPFYTTRKKGTGLGLSIVKQVVEFHGGEIEVFNNDPQPGLTVSLSFPYTKYDSEQETKDFQKEHV